MKVNVLGRSFKVKFVTAETLLKRVGFNAIGVMDWEKREILIFKDLNERERLLCLYHEMVHASHYVSGLNQIIAPELQEILCETTASLVEDIMRCKLKLVPDKK
jgi:hypothetical protein